MRMHKNHFNFTVLPAILLFCLFNFATVATAQSCDLLEWSELPALPDSIGFAGPFVGVSNDALIVAGGANFPDGPPWDGFTKIWHADAFVLTDTNDKWRTGFKLPRPIAYGVSVSWNGFIACLGGGDSEQHYSEAFLLRWTGETIETIPLPSMPRACAFGTGVLAGDTIYVAGGQESPTSESAMRSFLALDLSVPADQRQWAELPAWPSEGRILSVMAVQDGDVFLISGARLYRGPDQVTREFLTDCYRYCPQTRQWRRIADAPRSIVAAPNPGIPVGYAHILFLSGDDGKHFFEAGELKDKHPGFGEDLHIYHTITDTWTQAGSFPKTVSADLGPQNNFGTWPPVTTTCTLWRGQYVIPTGEIRPGVRTPKVLAARRIEIQKRFGLVNWIFLIVYIVALIAIGARFARREKSTDDFFLAGRRIPWWAAGLSIFGTQLSAITYLAMPARAFAANWWPLVMNMGILLIAPLVVYAYLPRLRRLNITTAYEFLEQRFDVSIRLLGSLAFITFQLGRMGIVVLLPALALSAVTGINVFVCIAVIGLLSTLYTVLGGIEAVIWTDVLQAIVLTGGALVALAIVISRLDGGVGELVSVGLAQSKFDLAYLSWDWTSEALAVVILGALFTNALIPYTTDQAVIQRYLATPDEKQAAKAIWLNGIMAIPMGLLFLSVGTGLYVFYSSNPDKLTPLDKADQMFALFIANEMPAGLAGLVIAGVFAAAMSSLDSSMHSISTVVTTDIVRRFWANLSETKYLRIARGLTVTLGISGTVAALFMASIDIRYLWDFFLGILGLLGGTLAGIFALGIFVPRVRTWHVWVGTSVSIGVLLYVQLQTNLNSLLYGAIGVFVCCLVALLCSFLTRSDS
ncbi:MAG: sodium/solute symporter [Planctomycetes bacterium]|nr:sodium/solute symporter [Planctomycetota bacterium]